MKYINQIRLVLVAFLSIMCIDSFGQVQMNFEFETPYGSNDVAGKYVNLNGIKMYYEEYGIGDPLLLIHGLGGDIKSMGNQIDHFKSKYRVISADTRGHGKTELNTDSLTYRQMADDYIKLVDLLELDSFYIIGWSDGGIIGLIMGINPELKIKKIVAMGANLKPDTTAVYSWAHNYVKKGKQLMQEKIDSKDTTKDWNIRKQLFGLASEQPSIQKTELSRIQAPVLVIAGDHDIIREEHTVEIFQSIPKAYLCIMPGETHFTPASNPVLFNSIVEKFISDPFTRPSSNIYE